MNHTVKVLVIVSAFGLALTFSVAPALAISVDLAKKCRSMAIKAHPPEVAGAKKGSAEAERAFYEHCVSTGGNEADENGQEKTSTPRQK